MSEWQTIETAPKDGRDILIFTHGLGRIGFFDSACGGVWSVWPGREKALPTHWMPLPPSPSNKINSISKYDELRKAAEAAVEQKWWHRLQEPDAQAVLYLLAEHDQLLAALVQIKTSMELARRGNDERQEIVCSLAIASAAITGTKAAKP